jgi:hypothetical protein
VMILIMKRLQVKTNFLAFAASYDSSQESNEFYSENSDLIDEKDKLQRVYNKLYVKFMKLREVNQQNVQKLNLFEMERSKMIEKIKCLEGKLIESQMQL